MKSRDMGSFVSSVWGGEAPTLSVAQHAFLTPPPWEEPIPRVQVRWTPTYLHKILGTSYWLPKPNLPSLRNSGSWKTNQLACVSSSLAPWLPWVTREKGRRKVRSGAYSPASFPSGVTDSVQRCPWFQELPPCPSRLRKGDHSLGMYSLSWLP